MDNYKIVEVKILFGACGVTYTAVIWWIITQSISDVLFVWCSAPNRAYKQQGMNRQRRRWTALAIIEKHVLHLIKHFVTECCISTVYNRIMN